jgi:hypothetical protein
VVRGALTRSYGEGQGVTVYPFFAQREWSAALVNASDEARLVEIQFPAGMSPPAKAVLLTEAGAEETSVERSGSMLTLRAPPQSLLVLPPRGEDR